MTSIASMRQFRLLALAAGFTLLSAAAPAQSPPAAEEAAEAEEEAAPPVEQKEDILKDIDIDKLDWSQLDVDASMLNLPSAKSRSPAKSAAGDDASWSSNARGNGAASVSV